MRSIMRSTKAGLGFAALALVAALQLVAAQIPAPAPPSNVRVLVQPSKGVWIGKDEIMLLPTAGSAWDRVLNDSNRDPGTPNVGDQDSRHDVYTMAEALVCVRTGQNCAKARTELLSAIGTEGNARWLAIARNMTAYIISADLLDLRADNDSTSDGSRVERWIRSFLTRQLPDNNTAIPRQIQPFASGSNAAAQEGLVYAAIGAYIHDNSVLARAWDTFRTYSGDPSAPYLKTIDLKSGVNNGWAVNSSAPLAINPSGTTKQVTAGYPGAGTTHRVDGAIINDICRGGYYQWPPLFTQYPWTGLAGSVPAALVLQRAGYPAFTVANSALLRAVDYLWFLRNDTGNTSWFDGVRGGEVVQVVNYMYRKSYPVQHPAAIGFTVGYTDWTFPTP
jgi:hypothetical protein